MAAHDRVSALTFDRAEALPTALGTVAGMDQSSRVFLRIDCPVKCLLLLAAALFSTHVCASGARSRDVERLTLHRAYAGDPVDSFHYFGRVSRWTPLGPAALTLWTRPGTAYLLDVGPCSDLPWASSIALTHQAGRVLVRFDKVLVADHGKRAFPCRIRQIRPLDVKALEQAERNPPARSELECARPATRRGASAGVDAADHARTAGRPALQPRSC